MEINFLKNDLFYENHLVKFLVDIEMVAYKILNKIIFYLNSLIKIKAILLVYIFLNQKKKINLSVKLIEKKPYAQIKGV